MIAGRGEPEALLGITKENVTMGPPHIQEPIDDDVEFDREMEYLVEPEEALDRGIGEVE